MTPKDSSPRSTRGSPRGSPRQNANDIVADVSIYAAVKEIMNRAADTTAESTDSLARLDLQFTVRGTKYEEFMRWLTATQRWSRYARSAGGRILKSELQAALSDYYEGEKVNMNVCDKGIISREFEIEDLDTPYEALFTKLRDAPSNEEFLRKFFTWLVPRWDQFWSNFQADGTMAWKDFRRFIQFENKWRGSAERAFQLLGEEDGAVHASSCSRAKRWFFHGHDKNDVTTEDCRRLYTRHYESLGRAWRVALDPHDTGFCCFHEFCKKSSEIGAKRNLSKIWADLTQGSTSRPIRYRDFDPHGDRLFSYFAASLSRNGGSLRDGWDKMCNRFGGKVRLDGFLDYCLELKIDNGVARQLFAILDPLRPESQRFLSLCDTLAFLSHWDPGKVSDKHLDPYKSMTDLKSAALSSFDIDLEADRRNTLEESAPVHPFTMIANRETYEITLVLSFAEHQEYLKRLKSRTAIDGGGLTPRSAPRTPRTSSASRGKRLNDSVKLSSARIPAFQKSLFDQLKDGDLTKPGLFEAVKKKVAEPAPEKNATQCAKELVMLARMMETNLSSRTAWDEMETNLSSRSFVDTNLSSRSRSPSVFELAVANLP